MFTGDKLCVNSKIMMYTTNYFQPVPGLLPTLIYQGRFDQGWQYPAGTREEFIGPETNLNRPCSRTGKAIQMCYRVKFIASYLLFSFVNKSFIEKQHYKYMYVRTSLMFGNTTPGLMIR